MFTFILASTELTEFKLIYSVIRKGVGKSDVKKLYQQIEDKKKTTYTAPDKVYL